jgi:hypothetical protein
VQMKKTRRRYDREFKISVVAEQVRSDLGIISARKCITKIFGLAMIFIGLIYGARFFGFNLL